VTDGVFAFVSVRVTDGVIAFVSVRVTVAARVSVGIGVRLFDLVPVGVFDGVAVRLFAGDAVRVLALGDCDAVGVLALVAVGTDEAVGVTIVNGHVGGMVAPLTRTVPVFVTCTWPLPLVVSSLSISQFDSVTESSDPNPIAALLPLSMLLFTKTQCVNAWDPST
jgi:hypothetical protein